LKNKKNSNVTEEISTEKIDDSQKKTSIQIFL
jgi:hypothetical protein